MIPPNVEYHEAATQAEANAFYADFGARQAHAILVCPAPEPPYAMFLRGEYSGSEDTLEDAVRMLRLFLHIPAPIEHYTTPDIHLLTIADEIQRRRLSAVVHRHGAVEEGRTLPDVWHAFLRGCYISSHQTQEAAEKLLLSYTNREAPSDAS